MPKKNINPEIIYRLYVVEMKSIPEISSILNECNSTIRKHLLYNKIPLRTRTEGVRNSAHKIGRKGIKKPHSEITKMRMSEARKTWSQKNAIGVSLKPSGYYEITKGVNKNRRLHDVIMEKHIGRRLENFEVVHHINGIKTDNRIKNLQLMTKSDHSSYHATEKTKHLQRDNKGQFIKQSK